LWTAVLIGPLGFLLSQHTFQQGQWATPAVAIITTVDPLIGIGIGVSWFDETITTTPTALAGELLAGAILTLGITLLARRGQQLKTQVEEQYVHQ
ncbi:MAG: hypothetical protein ACRDP4_14225, partial [Nocardioidaceae bacterium]